MVMMIVRFFLWAKNFISDTIMYDVSESRPEVGSSKNITWGSVMSSKAIEVRFF